MSEEVKKEQIEKMEQEAAASHIAEQDLDAVAGGGAGDGVGGIVVGLSKWPPRKPAG